MAKYPCGICGKNVRSSAILCTGSCNKWLHFKCAGLSLSDIKSMEKEDFLEEWKCLNCNIDTESDSRLTDNNCIAKQEPDGKTPLPLSLVTKIDTAYSKSGIYNRTLKEAEAYHPKKTNYKLDNKKGTLNRSVEEIENSLINTNFLNQDHSEEDKLEMAAKVGTALLEENNHLKEKVLRLESKLAYTEEQLEEVESHRELLLNKIQNLQQELQEVNNKRSQELKDFIKVQSVYEEHDQELGSTIDNYSKKISEQEKSITSLKTRLNTCMNAETTDISTQTASQANEQLPTTQGNSILLSEVTKLGTKIDNLTHSISSMSFQQSESGEKPLQTRPGSPQKTTLKNTPYNTPHTQKYNKLNKSMTKSVNKKTNHFSVSLQVKKSKTNRPSSEKRYAPPKH